MDIAKIPVGRSPPKDLNALIEIPLGGVEAGKDEKILAVPIDALHPFYTGIKSYEDLPGVLCEQIGHFFQHYKDLEKGKWVKGLRWVGTADAERLVAEAIEQART